MVIRHHLTALGASTFNLLRGVPEKDYEKAFKGWSEKLKLCILVFVKEEYFEGLKKRKCIPTLSCNLTSLVEILLIPPSYMTSGYHNLITCFTPMQNLGYRSKSRSKYVIIRDFLTAFWLLHEVSTRDPIISPRALAPGLIMSEG